MIGAPAFVTQNGPNINLVNEAGEPSRAWPDWYAPATRIWADEWHEGAVLFARRHDHSIRQRDDLGARHRPAAAGHYREMR